MTGYASLDAADRAASRRWELRSVNARGLDLRLRMPDLPGIEAAARAEIGRVAARGNVSLSLRIGTGEGAPVPRVDRAALEAALAALGEVERAADAAGVTLGPTRAGDVLLLRGVFEARDAPDAPDADALAGELSRLVAEWDGARHEEGAALRAACAAHLDAIAAQVDAADALGPARAEHQARGLADALARLDGAAVERDRLLQEVALLALRGDVTEELDRLRAHVAAARALLDADGPVGRRLDFLTQEFNREANTLCAKAQMVELTAIGLELKTLIDRLREQVQNIE